MNELWAEEMTEEQEELLLDKAADEVLKRRMEAPAILFLEMMKPLSYVGASTAVASAPFLIPFFGFDKVNDYSRLFSSSKNVERLIRRLESSKPGEQKLEGGKV